MTGERRAPETVGVVGGGRMGAGIAHAFLLAGSRVRLVERDDTSADAARMRIGDSIRRSGERDRGLDVEEVGARLTVGVEIDPLADCELVIEAVPEDRALKETALSSVDLDRRPRRVARASFTVPRPALLQPGAVLDAGRDRPGLRDR